MREILFRGKRTDNGEWIEGYYGVKGEGTDLEEHVIMVSTLQTNTSIPFFYFTDVKVLPETVCEYTGLKDKNGVRIFEKDLFKIGAEKEVFEVRYEHGCFVAYLGEKQYGLIGELMQCFVEVIGKIHDNPELICKHDFVIKFGVYECQNCGITK